MTDQVVYFDLICRVRDLAAIQPIKDGLALIPLGDGEYDMYAPSRDGEFTIISRHGELNAIKRQ